MSSKGLFSNMLSNYNVVISTEDFIEKYGTVFTLIVLYTTLLDTEKIVVLPRKVKRPIENPYFRSLYKFVAIFAISFTATMDIETSIISTIIFAVLVNIIRDPDERKEFPF
jgi:hypothetical protein